MREQLKSLRILIVDDETPARFLLKHLLTLEKDVQVVAEAEDAPQAIEFIRTISVDLILLDIHLRGDGAFSIIQKIGPEKMPAVIFVTAHREHAVDAFQLPAVDYLLKPVDGERFHQAITRARERLIKETPFDMQPVLSKLLEPVTGDPDRMVVYDGNKLVLLRLKEITWLKAEGNYVRAFSGDVNYKVRRPMSDVEPLLPEQFLKIHRSVIVNTDAVREIRRLIHGEYRLILKNGTELHISRQYRRQLQNQLHC